MRMAIDALTPVKTYQKCRDSLLEGVGRFLTRFKLSANKPKHFLYIVIVDA